MSRLPVSERDFQRAVCELADVLGVLWIHVPKRRLAKPGARSAYTTAIDGPAGRGWPDLTLVGTRVMFRELKAERGRVSMDQAIVMAALAEGGADVGVWRPADWDRIEAEMRAVSPRRAAA